MAVINAYFVLIGLLSASINVAAENNVALGKSAWQSAGYYDNIGHASKAVDGCLDGNYTNGCCTSTAGDSAEQWLGVDLGAVFNMYALSLTNRKSGAERLRQFSLYGSNMSHDPALATDRTLCADHPQQVAAGATERIQCELTARFVIVLKTMLPTDTTWSWILNLCEVQVEACSTTLINCTFCAASPDECSQCVPGNTLVDGVCTFGLPMESPIWQKNIPPELHDWDTSTCTKSDGRSQIQMRLSLDNNPPMNLTLIGRHLGCEYNLFVSVGSLTTTAGGFVGSLKLCTYVAEESVSDNLCFFDCAMENAVYELLVIQKHLPTAALEICEIKLGF